MGHFLRVLHCRSYIGILFNWPGFIIFAICMGTGGAGGIALNAHLQRDSNTGPLDLKSSILPLCHRPPSDIKNMILSEFLQSNYVICIFAACVLKLFAICGRTREACNMVKSLRKVDFFAPYWPLYMKMSARASLEEVLVAPLKPFVT